MLEFVKLVTILPFSSKTLILFNSYPLKAYPFFVISKGKISLVTLSVLNRSLDVLLEPPSKSIVILYGNDVCVYIAVYIASALASIIDGFHPLNMYE